MAHHHPPARPFAELRTSGLLWLINRTAFHPRGLALALHAGDVHGWSLLPSPDGGPWTYPEDTDTQQYHQAEATLAAARDARRATAEPHSGVTRCASCTVRAATYLNFQSQALCCTCAQCDCGQIPCARLDPALACRATLATEDHGTIRCYFPAGHYGPGRVHEAWAGDRRWWLDGDPGAVPHQADAPDEAEDDPGGTVRTRPDTRPSTVRDGGGRPTRTPALATPRTERPPAPTSTDIDCPGEDGRPAGGEDAGRTAVRRAEIRQAIDGAFLAPGTDGRPVPVIPAGELTLGPDGLTDTERQRKTLRDTLNAELSHDDKAAVWNLTLAPEPTRNRGLLEHAQANDEQRTCGHRADVHQAVTAAFLDSDPGLIRVAGLESPPRCSCGLTGELLAVDPAGAHMHAAPAAEDRHPAVIAWGQCFDRAQAAEDQLAAVRDVITDMEATTGARHWARLLRQAAGEPGDNDGSPQTWRRRAVRRALELSRAHSLITAVCDLAHEPPRPAGPLRADGYGQALADLRAILTAFGHLDDTRADGAELAHRCTNPQAAAFVEVDDCPIPIVHARPPKENGTR